MSAGFSASLLALPRSPAEASGFTFVEDRFEEFRSGGVLWRVLPAYRDLLFDRGGLRLEDWRQDGHATLIKNGAGRTIHRVRLPGLELYVKHFRATNPVSLAHQFLRADRARKEFDLANQLRRAGVRTIRPLAIGEIRRYGLLQESFLLTEGIANGLTLFDLIERFILAGRLADSPRLRLHLAEKLAGLAASIHEAGVEHRDLHERNVVVQPRGNGTFRFYMLDLHELRVRGSLSWAHARRDLARMGRYFTLRTNATDRHRFFRAYALHRGFTPQEAAEKGREMELATDVSRADFWRRRDQRAAQRTGRATEIKRRGACALATPDIPMAVIEELLARPETPFDEHVARWLKMGRCTRVAEADLPAIRRDNPFVYKQYFFKGWHEAFAALFRANQATRAWLNGAALLLRELPTPRPLALIHKTVLGMPVTSFLLTERVPEGTGLSDYLDRVAEPAGPGERRRIVVNLVRLAALLLRKLHERRVTHRDLKATNVLAEPTDDPAAPKLWIIDLDGVQTWQSAPAKHRVQNLARFHVSFCRSPYITRADKLRFLRDYLGSKFQDRAGWKALWQSIGRDTEAKIRRNLRKGRALY
ncbi:MAG TPA: lipopolysaccharide kinase InaA family protein [Planctomycetia bacterium]|nr:lipopolysaccharide kinase InaA family protein [Planctomycetia bacterium]